MWYHYLLGLLGGLLLFSLLVLITAYICYRRVFYSRPRRPYAPDEYDIPDGEIYEPYRERMVEWMRRARCALPYEAWEIKSFDGLTLRARYYEYAKGAVTEILFHGYKGNGERDLSGGIERCFRLGRNALIVDQRASGRSDGKTITFGIHERYDCVSWANEAVKRLGEDCRLVLTGISMGAATVMMAAAEPLPPRVVCVLADCGYSSAREIICKIIREMRLPARLLYPFVRLGARLYGRFRLEETSPIEAVARATVPMIFIHGDADAFVPCDMSRRLYAACSSAHKHFEIIAGAGHGLAFPVDEEGYLSTLRAFQSTCGFQ